MKQPNRDIPENRKTVYYVGMGMIILGIILFLSVFFSSFGAMTNFGQPPSMLPGLIGFVLIMIGTALRTIGARGLAGSGVILDPQKAKHDLEPYARAAGGLLKDVIEETDDNKTDDNQPQVKLRCRNCQSLNDETANYCQNCGQPL